MRVTHIITRLVSAARRKHRRFVLVCAKPGGRVYLISGLDDRTKARSNLISPGTPKFSRRVPELVRRFTR